MALPRFLSAALGVASLCAFGSAGAVAPDTHPTVTYASRHDVSAPMRDIVRNMPPEAPLGTEEEPYLIPNILLKPSGASNRKPYLPGIQRAPIGVPAPAIDLNWEGVSAATSGCGCLPPDTEGDVSDVHYIQWVNTRWAIYDKTDGSVVQGPMNGNSFFVGFGGKCETTNSGDPIALWDPRAQRWIMSQFVTSAPFAQCVAVSTTSDPMGTYNRYQFDSTLFGDYPKLAVWTDDSGSQNAYLMTTHEFSGQNFQGAALSAFERDAMVAGDPTPALVHFGGFVNEYGIEPINLVGQMNAPANACGGYTHFDSTTSDYEFWDICIDWTTPTNTTISANPTLLPGTPFVPYFNEVPQEGSANGLDPFGTHIMYRANARAFPADAPTRISVVVNHVVQADVQQGGIDWVHFNLDDHGATFTVPTPLDKTLLEEGVYAPDANNRWLGGIAIDANGNIGVGYSESSETIHPQILITGRTSEDPPGTLEDEQNCTDGIGNGSQTSSSDRWGDYSAMSVDPVDQCTFYYTNEYYPTTTGASWHTRVCSFKFDNCGLPDYALVAESPRRIELCGATTSTDPTYSLRAGVLNGFTGPVNLVANGVPPGATGDFSVNPINAPGTSVMTLTGGAALPSGEYAMTVDGTNGTSTRTLAISLGVSANTAAAVTLLTPVDAASEVLVRPTLVWGTGANDEIFADGFDGTPQPLPGGSTDALSYTVDVATDAAFTSIVTSATVTTTSWTVDVTLDATTTYYWRVTPHNYCGDGAVSTTFSFTTGVPGQCPTGTTTTTVYSDDFEGGVNGWTAGGTGATGWTQGTPPAGTGMTTTVWQVPDNTTTSDRTLDTPVIALPANAVQVILSFDAYHKSEQNGPGACWDLSSMETSTDGTTFNYLDGTHFFTDPYNGAGSNDTPVGAREGWCYPGPAGSAAPTHSIVDLDSFAGQSIQLRYRMTSDSNTAASAPNGLIIDNFKVDVCQ